MLEHLAFTAVEFKDPDVKKYLETVLTSGGPCKSLGLTGYDFTLYSFPAKNEKELTQAISVLAGISSEVCCFYVLRHMSLHYCVIIYDYKCICCRLKFVRKT